ncbi:MAG TPA: beta-ketoacyl synthase N-terminal-like domain-containing protein, partial [Actinoplanes sp.]|nr:beta-ketoacyl synthase N-terminal-like domain-containing protein [Actinoplanes sp.]
GELVDMLVADGVGARLLAATFASHSPMVDVIREPLRAALGTVAPVATDVPIFAGAVGGRIDPSALDADYWFRNMREPVRFQDATVAALEIGIDVFLEVSPHPMMLLPIGQTAQAAGRDAVVLATLRRDEGDLGRWEAALAEAYVHGVTVDWSRIWAPDRSATVALPTYAFQRTAYWLDSALADLDGPAAAPVARRPVTARLVASAVAAALGHADADAIDPGRTFRDLGVDSVVITDIAARLAARTGRPVPVTAVYDHPTAEALAAYLSGAARRAPADGPAAARPEDDPIAIVAAGCRLPGGVQSPEDLWTLLAEGRDAIGDLPGDRGWNVAELHDPDPSRAGRSSTGKGGFLADAGDFDAGLFGISPREALAMDPQQRLLLETAWETLERAGIAPDSLRGTRTGVFVGVMDQGYGPRWNEDAAGTEGFLLTGTTASVNAGRISYTLGLEGPAVATDTACSSSLVALHLAVRALRAGDCSAALVGGVTVMSTPETLIEFSRQQGLAADGRCKAFAAGADGTGLAEGVAMVFVERLADARRLGHPVLALVRGSAVNADGASNGLTAPSGTAQRDLIRQALADARLEPSDVDAVEAHGTGTALGDPIEGAALVTAYAGERERPLLVGSLKSNIGHTQAAAGLAGVLKMVGALHAERLPRTLHVDQPTPLVDWDAGPARLLTEAADWPTGGRVRRAGISSFGISGTNAHVIIEEAPAAETVVPPDEPAGPRPFVLSGATPGALRDQAARLRDHLAGDPLPLPALARSLASTRTHLDHRSAIVAAGHAELTEALDGL